MERFPRENHHKIEKIPELYSLSRTDFLDSNELPKVTDFKIGDRVTRDNFCSLIIKSFAVSRGDIDIQAAFFSFLKRKFSFDYQRTFQVFVEQGGWKALSEEEKQKFIRAFDAVKKHAKRGVYSGQTKIEALSIELLSVSNHIQELTEEDERYYLNEAANKGCEWGERLSDEEYGHITNIRDKRKRLREQKEEKEREDLDEMLKAERIKTNSKSD